MIDQLTSFLGFDISYALGWTIIHSLWQVSLLALIMSATHKVYQHKSSEFKYNVSFISVLLSLVCSVITFFIYYFEPDIVPASEAFTHSFTQISSTQPSTSIIENINNVFTNNLNHINTIWIVGALLFSLKFVFSFVYIQYIKSTATELLDPIIHKVLANTKVNLGVKKAVHFMESAKINVPMVLGHMKPIILLPVGMINMLTTQEIEAIIAHELFHIKRNDYIVNLALTIIEIIYFFHPAMWWISANIKAERENCCDDAAINNNIDSVTYAKVLVKLEEMRNSGIPSLAMPFASNKHQLLNRIKRILNMEQTKNDIKEKSVATVLLLFVAILFASNTNSQMLEQELTFDIINEIQSNWEDANLQSDPVLNDEIKLIGDEEIVLDIKKGLFSSITVDGAEQETGEVVSRLKKDFMNKTTKDLIELDERFHLKGSPMLTFKNQNLLIPADVIEYENSKKLLTQQDTFPQEEESSFSITTDKNGKKIEITKNKGKITKLKIDGKTIPESDYQDYQNDIDSVLDGFTFDMSESFDEMRFDMENLFDGKSMDSVFSNSFGMMFDGQDWREFGGNIEQLLDNDVLQKMRDMEGFRRFDLEGLENLEGLKKLENLKELKGLEQLQNLEGLEGLEEALEKMGIQLDSSMQMFNLEMDGFEGFNNFKGFEGFEHFNDENMDIRDGGGPFGSSTVVDKLGNALNSDGLLNEYKSNKIELSGKHLKINGEKMPKALFNKYKNIYQEETGAPLTKKSKMIFDVEGKPSKRKVRSF